MKRSFLIILILIFIKLHTFEWTFDKKYQSELLFIHPLANYEYSFSEKRNWQQNQLTKNVFRINAGSVTTSRLMKMLDIKIHEKLSKNWKFDFNYRDYDFRYYNKPLNYQYMGFARKINKNLELYFQINPFYEKEKIDSEFGINLFNKSKKEYLKIGIQRRDFVYDSKNHLGGKSTKNPYAIDLLVRKKLGKFTIYKEILWQNGFSRNYPDSTLAPDFTFHEQKDNYFTSNIYYNLTRSQFLKLDYKYYEFYEKKRFIEETDNYTYRNKIHKFRFTYHSNIKDKFKIDTSFQYIEQNSKATGFRDYNYKRSEIFFPMLFLKMKLNKRNFLETAYFGSNYSWEKKSISDSEFKRDDYVDKIKIGLIHRFDNNSELQFSISHMLSLYEFGGGNLYFVKYF